MEREAGQEQTNKQKQNQMSRQLPHKPLRASLELFVFSTPRNNVGKKLQPAPSPKSEEYHLLQRTSSHTADTASYL